MHKSFRRVIKVYSGIHKVPEGDAKGEVTPGCIVLEGGAFRGVYTSGVLDALMQEGINMSCCIGVSAGAMNGMNYVSGQIGRSARVNLIHRHNPEYVGLRTYGKNHGIIGFDFVFDGYECLEPFCMKRFGDEKKRFMAVASNCLNGKAEYFEKGKCGNIAKAIQASASMPFLSRPVNVDGIPCLDGGCTDAIPYVRAMKEGYDKIILVRTRPRSFRKKRDKKQEFLIKKYFQSHPEFMESFLQSVPRYNRQCDEAEALEASGKILVISPSAPVNVSRLERDMEKLGELYWMGYHDAKKQMDRIHAYLA